MVAKTLYQWDDVVVSPPIPYEHNAYGRYGGPGVRAALLYVAIRIADGIRINPILPQEDGTIAPATAVVGQSAWTRKPNGDFVEMLFAVDTWEALTNYKWLGFGPEGGMTRSIHEVPLNVLHALDKGFSMEFQEILDAEGKVLRVEGWVDEVPFVLDRFVRCCEQGTVAVPSVE
jgi:hypothetical protein